MSAISSSSSSKSVHADKTGCICSRRCQVTINYAQQHEGMEKRKSILTSKTWMGKRKGCEFRPGESLKTLMVIR